MALVVAGGTAVLTVLLQFKKGCDKGEYRVRAKKESTEVNMGESISDW